MFALDMKVHTMKQARISHPSDELRRSSGRCEQVKPCLAHRREHENPITGAILPDSDTWFEG